MRQRFEQRAANREQRRRDRLEAIRARFAAAFLAVYLGLFANDDDGVNYFNTDGPAEMTPRLIVDAR